jgi:hypothetical protein
MMIPLQGLIKRRCLCMCVDVCRLCVVMSNERVSEHVKQYSIKSRNVLMHLSRVDMVRNNAYNFFTTETSLNVFSCSFYW